MKTDSTHPDNKTSNTLVAPHNTIELRSEKTQKLLGEIPPSLIRIGTVVIAVIFLALIAALCLIPYPYSDGESILMHFVG